MSHDELIERMEGYKSTWMGSALIHDAAAALRELQAESNMHARACAKVFDELQVVQRDRDSLKNRMEVWIARLMATEQKRDELQVALDDAEADGIHTCSTTCPRHACVLMRERDAALREVEEQARLLGMGSEREARLMAERDALRSSLISYATHATHCEIYQHPAGSAAPCSCGLAAALASDAPNHWHGAHGFQSVDCPVCVATKPLHVQIERLKAERDALKAENERLRKWSRLQVEIISGYEQSLTGKEAGQ